MLQTLRYIYETIWEARLLFALVFIGVFAFMYSFLFAIDFVPEATTWPEYGARKEVAPQQQASAFSAFDTKKEEKDVWIDPLPQRISIDEIGIDIEVLNPISRNVDDLDGALKKGVVRHPDSGDFKSGGNVFLFGHSSYLPTVHNKNYRAFNGIQKLEKGDEIRVQSSNKEYVYAVTRVSEVSAAVTEVLVGGGRDTLTLVTCNSFGSEDDRFIVEASLVGVYSL